jgi:hypothetical protein
MTIDHHIHIGYFNEKYYNPIDVLQTVADVGIEKCLYSSTSTCRKGINYIEIEKELYNVTQYFSHDKMQALLWFIPNFIEQGLTVETAFASFPYHGLKLHSRAHSWNLNDKIHINYLHSLFSHATENRLPILIHTGEDECEKPNFFEQFFVIYKKANIILAHCRPLDETIRMFEKHNNVNGDTAFLSKNNIQTIIKEGYMSRLLTGSDFPITHYYSTKYGRDSSKSLTAQYKEDIFSFEILNTISF